MQVFQAPMIRLNCSPLHEQQLLVTSRPDDHSRGLMHEPETCCMDNLCLETAGEASVAKGGMRTSRNNRQVAEHAAQVPHLLHLAELIFDCDKS